VPNEGTIIRVASGADDIAIIRELFLEYASSLGFSLCFQGFDQELERLPGEYSPPDGRLFIAEYNGKVAGCIALKRLGLDICEMKRLYLRNDFRGLGLGRILAEKLIAEARAIGYRKMALDTIEDKMKSAVALYRSLGFNPCAPYYHNPIPGALYMELEL
jgi:ribosomal protein S18 acetylase RimI-like enzyme